MRGIFVFITSLLSACLHPLGRYLAYFSDVLTVSVHIWTCMQTSICICKLHCDAYISLYACEYLYTHADSLHVWTAVYATSEVNYCYGCKKVQEVKCRDDRDVVHSVRIPKAQTLRHNVSCSVGILVLWISIGFVQRIIS